MSDAGSYGRILDKIIEIKEDIGALRAEVSNLKEAVTDTRTKIVAIEQQDILQNRLLDEHIAGVRTTNERLTLEINNRKSEGELIQKQILEIDARLKQTELMPTFLSSAKKIALWVSAVAGAVAALGRIFHWF